MPKAMLPLAKGFLVISTSLEGFTSSFVKLDILSKFEEVFVREKHIRVYT